LDGLCTAGLGGNAWTAHCLTVLVDTIGTRGRTVPTAGMRRSAPTTSRMVYAATIYAATPEEIEIQCKTLSRANICTSSIEDWAHHETSEHTRQTCCRVQLSILKVTAAFIDGRSGFGFEMLKSNLEQVSPHLCWPGAYVILNLGNSKGREPIAINVILP
jgi:hypothetical protein